MNGKTLCEVFKAEELKALAPKLTATDTFHEGNFVVAVLEAAGPTYVKQRSRYFVSLNGCLRAVDAQLSVQGHLGSTKAEAVRAAKDLLNRAVIAQRTYDLAATAAAEAEADPASNPNRCADLRCTARRQLERLRGIVAPYAWKEGASPMPPPGA